jgi:ATP-dependent RNA helicase RhlE
MDQQSNNFSRPQRSSYPRRDNSSGSSYRGSGSSYRGSNSNSNSGYGSNNSGGRRYGGGNRFGGGNSRSRFKRGGAGIDPSKYVNKASGVVIEEVYNSVHTFADFKIDERLKDNIIKKGYLVPKPIQDQSIPHILEGKDLIGLANTGTGKTAAFLIPLIHKVLNNAEAKVLIVVPTRELAVQINDEMMLFAGNLPISSALCIGGADIRRQTEKLRRRPSFVIGTPGRLKDLQKRKILNLSFFNNIVLDEVDRMLDMGFIEDIKFLISFLPENRQSLFFSATTSRKADLIAQSLLRNPITVSVVKGETSKNVDQDIIKCSDKRQKVEILSELLTKAEFKKVLIFTRTKRGAEELQEDLFKKGFKVDSIHGDKSQYKRERALTQFRKDYVTILVATDVAARGLDISDITHVINFNEPENFEDYIHRIGRTGRGDKKGIAITFVD